MPVRPKRLRRPHLGRHRVKPVRPEYGGSDTAEWLAIQSAGTMSGNELGWAALLLVGVHRLLDWLRRRG